MGEETEKWLFSVVDIVAVLTYQPTQRGATLYWGKLKQRLREEGSELLTNCQQLKLKAADGKKYLTDVADTEQILRLMQPSEEYAKLTDLMSKTWSGMTTREYKKFKDLKKENLRDNVTNTELVLNMLAEVAATDISIEWQPTGFDESAKIAKEGATTAKVARKQLEKSLKKSTVSSVNAKLFYILNE